MEGLLSYLQPEDRRTLLQRLVQGFKKGHRKDPPQAQTARGDPFVKGLGIEEVPFMSRLTFYIMYWMPSLWDPVRFVRLGFSEEAKGDSGRSVIMCVKPPLLPLRSTMSHITAQLQDSAGFPRKMQPPLETRHYLHCL
ncbi:hypothetical protein HD806DRAFT_115322 [Xylariaceae sp. AK1471]|nr:hypothetical protein HD806DRAFT_115322 [Xylariaceae sp. AK1471]